MVDPSSQPNPTSSSSPHQPPTYYTTPASPLSLHRTNSKHLYDADVHGVDSEFAIHSNNRHHDDPDLSKLSRTESSGGGSKRQHQRQASSKSIRQRGEKDTLAEEIKEWEEEDAGMRGENRKELEEVRNGGSGRKAEREYEEKLQEEKAATRQVNSSNNLDLEAQVSSDHSTEAEDPPLGEKAPSSSGHSAESDKEDKNIVTWDSPDDPANPRNWSIHHKWAVTASKYCF